jgi:uncharacterized membrane protein
LDGRATVPTGRALAVLFIVAGALGLAGSFILTLEEIEFLKNPNYQPSCNINPVISCGTVMRSGQAELFGVSNPIFGLVAFAAVVTIGVAMLAGATYRRWLWLGVWGGALCGVGFVHYLINEALYDIGALCPYCTVVWVATIALFWYTTVHNLKRDVIPVPAGWRPAVREIARYHWVIPVTWYLVIALMVLNRFWSYWRTLL